MSLTLKRLVVTSSRRCGFHRPHRASGVKQAHSEVTTSPEALDALEKTDANAKCLRSKDNDIATTQNAYFNSFVVSLVDSYNDDPARMQGLEKSLIPHIVLVSQTNRYAIDNNNLTNYNVCVINALIDEHSSHNSVYTMLNENLKILFYRISKKNP